MGLINHQTAAKPSQQIVPKFYYPAYLDIVFSFQIAFRQLSCRFPLADLRARKSKKTALLSTESKEKKVVGLAQSTFQCLVFSLSLSVFSY